jgi:hypothetical protein
MRRLLALLALALATGSAFAQHTINVAVTYTAGAGAYAVANGTTVKAKVDAIVAATNAAYSAAGIAITLVPYYQGGSTPQAAKGAPSDSSAMDWQYDWASRSIEALTVRKGYDASISVHISEPGVGVQDGAMSPILPAPWNTAVAAIPYRYLDSQLENAISQMIGATWDGYAVRSRTYPADPIWGGQNICFHTRENGPGDPGVVVPYLPYWQTAATPSTNGVSPQSSCDAEVRYLALNGGQPAGTYASGVATYVSANDYLCTIRNTGGSITAGPHAFFYANAGGSPIICADPVVGYSNPNAYYPNTTIPMGDATHNSVGAMNARAADVWAFQLQNGRLLNTQIDSYRVFGVWDRRRW